MRWNEHAEILYLVLLVVALAILAIASTHWLDGPTFEDQLDRCEQRSDHLMRTCNKECAK